METLMQNLPETISGISIVSLVGILFALRKAIKKNIKLINIVINFYSKYRQKLLAVFAQEESRADLKNLLMELDETLEVTAGILSRLVFIPRKWVNGLKDLIKKSTS